MQTADRAEDYKADEIFVVVPSYNHARFVERTLRSIFRQTLAPSKLLVIDDGSTDGSPAVIEKFLSECPFECELITRENRGLCQTLNQALDMSHGKYFAYISSDDVWLPDFLKSRIGILSQRPNAVLAYGPAFVIDENDNIFDNTGNWGDHADGDATEMLLKPVFPASAGVLYRGEVLNNHRWNESVALEDYDLYLRLSQAGEFALDKNVLSAWRIHDRNTSGDSARMLDEWLEAQDRNACILGLSANDLAGRQRKIKFDAIDAIARSGQRARAMELLRETAPSFSLASTLLKLVRIFLPVSAYRLWRAIRDSRRKKKYGKIAG